MIVIIGIFAFIGFVISGYISQEKAIDSFIKREYHGIINGISFPENNRGSPRVKIGNQWYYFSIGEDKVQYHININDSIAKDSGTATISVYKKAVNGKWVKKGFK